MLDGWNLDIFTWQKSSVLGFLQVELAFFDASNPHFCRLGSVKGNIAHANCAAGATGLIKARGFP